MTKARDRSCSTRGLSWQEIDQATLDMKRDNINGTMKRLLLSLLVLATAIVLAACASTTAPAAANQSQTARIVETMQSQGADVANLRPAALRGQMARKFVEGYTFDIPGIDLDGQPAGKIHIFREQKHAEFDTKVYGMLGE